MPNSLHDDNPATPFIDVPEPSAADLKAAREKYLKARRDAAARKKLKRGDALPDGTIVDRKSRTNPVVTPVTRVTTVTEDSEQTPLPSNPLSVLSENAETPADHDRQATIPQGEAILDKVAPPKLGRPQVWAQDADITTLWKTHVIEWLIDGKSLSSFVKVHPAGPSRSTVLKWISEDATFAVDYTRAREAGADALADGIIDIADSVENAGPQDSAKVNAARLRVDARKWSASKLKPGAYADRLETHHSGNIDQTHRLDDATRATVLAGIMARMAIAAAPDLSAAVAAIQTAAGSNAAPLIIEGKAERLEPAPSADRSGQK